MRGSKPTELKVIQGGIVDVPPPPKGLPKDAVDDWNTVCADLTDRGLINDAMLPVVEVYCTTIWQVRKCREAIELDGTFVKGQNGVPKAHPASTMMQKAQETATRLAVELGLTPSARARRGLGGGGRTPPEGEADAQGV